MTKPSQFTLHDDDIVVLESKGSDTTAKGWVNLGSHAVQLEINSNGDLQIEVHARTNETTPLASLNISKEISVHAGGKDPVVFNKNHENEARYMFSTGWGHIFMGKREDLTRWVFDKYKNTLVTAQILESSKWTDLNKFHKQDLLNSIYDNEAISRPDVFGLEESFEIPSWALLSLVVELENAFIG